MQLQKIFWSSIVMVSCIAVSAQKPSLDTGVLYHWPSVEEHGILTADGNYAGYAVAEIFGHNPVYYLKGTYSSWEKKLGGTDKADFTSDSRHAVYLKEETLHIVTLGSDEEEKIPQISSYQLFKKGSEEYLLYYSKTARQLSIRSNNGKQDNYADVDAWLLSANGSMIFKKSIHDKGHQSLSIIDLQNKDEHVIWEGGATGEWILADSGEEAAFSTKDPNGINQIWYYRSREEKARLIADDQSKGIDQGLTIGKLLNFSKDGSMLFFNLRKELPKPDPNMVSVDVWSYRDVKLQSIQLKESSSRREQNYLSVIEVAQDYKIKKVQQDGEKLSGKAEGRYVLFDRAERDEGQGERAWSIKSEYQYDIMDIQTGKREKIYGYRPYRMFSPGGRFLELQDYQTGDICTYELSTGIIRSITAKIPISFNKLEQDEGSAINGRPIGVIAWLPDDAGMLIEDSYDLWEMDPLGERPAINLTNFEGAKTKTTFRLAMGYPPGQLEKGNVLILSAFNHENKDNGFYRIGLHKQQVPEKLNMGAYAYYIPEEEVHLNPGVPIVRAENADVYLVRRETVSESPNFFVTKDFKTFKSVSDVYPEKNYNWVRSRLLSFTRTDGSREQGVLYLPENFDLNKKYPLIFQYYQRRTAELNLYRPAYGSNGELNVPWFVSHDYLVFIPDIHFVLGKAGESVVQTIMGAVKLLKTFPYVDSRHMGLQGHSYGGWETNYLVTHTDIFAAALSSSGPSDWISSMSSLTYSATSTPDFVQYGQGRMGTMLWENPDYYIKNSPIFYADKVTTPLMMISNKRDHNVEFTQGLELFTALRRLGKKAWMLQYDEGGHGVNGKERMDYLLRSTQFFDHYLKGAPAPKWMVEGIPASKKQIDDGMKFEPAGVEPGPGLLTPEAQKKVDALQHKKPITVTFN